MRHHLVRHAHAGDRWAWDGPDHLRPLSSRGEGQARALCRSIEDEPVAQVWSSAAVRCVQTVEPLAERLGLAVATHDELFEGGSAAVVLADLEAADATVVACSHGDVIPAVVATALGHGAVLHGPPSPAKAGAYVLDVVDGRVTTITYVPPPDVGGI